MYALSLRTQKAMGHTLLEYTLLGGIVLVTSLGALSILGYNLSDSFENLMTKPVASQLPQQASKNQINYSATSNDLTFTTQAGTSFTLQNYPQDMDVAISTIGANGTTQIILENMRKIANQLLQSGEITQEQANLLIDLSNQGHEIGNIEAILENAKNLNPSPDTRIEYNGESFQVYELASKIGTLEYSRIPSGSRIQVFKELQAKAASQGALNDPIVNRVVTLMSEQIIALANGVESGIKQIVNDGKPLEEYEQHAINAMNKETPVNGSLLELIP